MLSNTAPDVFLKDGLWFALDLDPNQETTSFRPPFFHRHKPTTWGIPWLQR